jgi:23S rRNA (guanosine2251-2'-O)-methyltransferase
MARKDRSSSQRPEGRGGKGRPPKPRGGGGPRSGGGRPPAARRDAAPQAPEATAPTANVYGRNAVREALKGRRRVRHVWVTASTAKEFPGAEVVEADEVTARCGSDAHQGVCAEADPYPYADAAELLAQPDPFLVALDEVTDPQNLGAVIRTAECAGATGVIIPERRSAEVTAAVAKASAGAVEHLPVARVRNLADFLAEAKAAGAWTYGAAAEAGTPYRAPDYSGGVVLVLGAEGKGLRPRVASMCDELVALPIRGRIDSLNVSAAGAVLMYEILQKRLDTST